MIGFGRTPETDREAAIIDLIMADDNTALLQRYFPAPLPSMMHEPYELYVGAFDATIEVQESAAWFNG